MVARAPPPQRRADPGSFLNAIVALAAIGGSTNAVVHLLAIAGRLGVDLTLDDFDRTGCRRPAAGGPAAGRPLPDGGLPPRRRPAAPCCARCGTCSTRTRSPSPASRWSSHLDDAQIWDREVIRLPRRAAAAARRDRRAVRQPRPRRRGDQAGGRVAAPAAAPRPGGGVRLDRGHARPHRRPRPRRRRRLGAGAARLRSQGLPGHARGGEHAAADQAARSRACGTWCGSATAG